MESLIHENFRTGTDKIPTLGKRTKFDFSNHEVLVTKTDDLLIHYLKVPGTVMDSVKFINTNGILAVTGDYGNWIFCREFHPTKEGYVSDHYWLEKLKITSCQNPYRYDPEGTATEIREILNNPEEELTPEEREYLQQGLRESDNELDYTYHAFRNGVGRYDDLEQVPLVKKLSVQLPYIFDAFEEICRRLKESIKPEEAA